MNIIFGPKYFNYFSLEDGLRSGLVLLDVLVVRGEVSNEAKLSGLNLGHQQGWKDEFGDKADVFGPLEDGKINKLVDKLGLLLLHLP